MPKKHGVDSLRVALERGLSKAGIRADGRTFGISSSEGYCASYVCGSVVIEIIIGAEDKRLEKLKKFQKQFGRSYQVFLFTHDHLKDILTVTPFDSLFTVSSLDLLVDQIKKSLNN